MAKSVHNDVLDAALNYIADNASSVILCSAEPTTYTEATATYDLATIPVTAGVGNGDFTLADGDTSGRKLTVTAQSETGGGDTTGTPTHYAIVDAANTKLLYVTTASGDDVAAGGDVSISAFDIEIADPS